MRPTPDLDHPRARRYANLIEEPARLLGELLRLALESLLLRAAIPEHVRISRGQWRASLAPSTPHAPAPAAQPNGFLPAPAGAAATAGTLSWVLQAVQRMVFPPRLSGTSKPALHPGQVIGMAMCSSLEFAPGFSTGENRRIDPRRDRVAGAVRVTC